MSLLSNFERGGSISKYAKHGLLLGLVVTTMAGCASMSPEECKAANWHQVGYQDGQQGENPQIINDYTQDCAEAKVVVDRIEWTKGFHEGTKVYCDPSNGYQVGVEGREYYGVCENPKFLKNYQMGKQEYQRQQRLNNLNAQIASLDDQISHEKDAKKAKQLREQRKDLAHERSQLLNPDVNMNINFKF
ncbi:ATPase [Vibrio ishigakensis]|uniref:ATPase n=2 Tax=Vibrio ishigakensis TaxID=1481914 RepID=A0A0B8QLP7_9VIBR|nr:ATPase [Vibrio ishigakensis]